ncbi:MAG: nucleotidyl cyclase domain-containing protein [Candidatus Aquicultorales bacterium]
MSTMDKKAMPSARNRRLLGQEAQARFRRYEILITLAGSLSIVVSAVVSFLRGGDIFDFLGQLLIIPVLLASLHYGRTGGIVAAVIASLVFLTAEGAQVDIVSPATLMRLFGIKTLGYFIVGFVGGEAMNAVRFYFARSGGTGGVDPGSGLYVADFITGMIEKAVFLYERYSAVFSLVVLELDGKALAQAPAFQRDRYLAELGNLFKANLRIVDEIGRLDDYAFAILLPYTELRGAQAAAERIGMKVAEYYGLPLRELVSIRVYGVPEHLVELRDLCGLPSVAAATALKAISGTKGA